MGLFISLYRAERRQKNAANDHVRHHSDGSMQQKQCILNRKPPQIRRRHKLPNLSPNSTTSTNLPPLPPTPLTQKQQTHKKQQRLSLHQKHIQNKTVSINMNEYQYNEWLLLCFKNSIIDSLLELLQNDELRVYVFDDGMISHHMIGNDMLSAIEYLFECQFAFISNGSAYLDFNGFASGMRKINIHFENPEIAIPLIFEQLVGINQNNQKNIKTKIDYNH